MRKVFKFFPPVGLCFADTSFSQKQTVDKRFTGTWEANAGDARTVVTIKEDGRWVSETTSPRITSVNVKTGSWKVAGDKFTWTYDKDNSAFKANEEDINPVIEISHEKFVLREMRGNITVFKRI